jgi:glycine cleavage system H protein
MNPDQLQFAKSHEWVSIATVEGHREATVGLSAFAVEALTDLVFMELPEVGRHVTAGEPFGEIESVKAVSDLYSPVTGEIVAVNGGLPNNLHLLNDDPYGEGWLIKVKLAADANTSDLLDFAAYSRLAAEGDH